MRKLFKSKKGGIPVINEILSFYNSHVPDWIKKIVFVLLITTLAGFLIPIIFQFFGYACVQEGSSVELYQVPLNNLIDKLFLDLQRGFSTFIFGGQVQVSPDAFPLGDKRFMRIPEECFVERTNITGQTNFGYTAACTDCPEDTGYGLINTRSNLICAGDGEPTLATSLVYRNFCTICAPKDPYYYNHSLCQNNTYLPTGECYFTIDDFSEASNINAAFLNSISLQNVKDLGGVKRNQDPNSFVSAQCEDVNKPQLYFFNIKVFDRTLWIYIFIAEFLIGFALTYYGLFM